MLLTILMDLLSSCLTLSDFGLMAEDDFSISSCGFDLNDKRRTLVILSLFFVFSRGVLVLLLNIGIFVNVAMIYIRLGKPKIVAPVVSESKTNQEDLWIPYPRPREGDQSHEHPPEQSGGGHHYQAPQDRHRAGPRHDEDPHHQSRLDRSQEQVNNRTARRAPSFADRLREADTNFSNAVGS